MAISSKDIETLWGRYQTEGVNKGVSVSQYFEANGVPYHVFEKWHKKCYRQPDVVECVVDGIPVEDQQSCPAPSSNDKTMVQGHVRKDSVTVAHVNICLSNGMRIDYHKKVAATYLTFVEKCKLMMKKIAFDFFKGFFCMTSGGRTDYELIVLEHLC